MMAQGLIRWAMRPHANYKLLLLITRSKVLVIAPQCHRRPFLCSRLVNEGGASVNYYFECRPFLVRFL